MEKGGGIRCGRVGVEWREASKESGKRRGGGDPKGGRGRGEELKNGAGER